jgi:hypothetical protein
VDINNIVHGFSHTGRHDSRLKERLAMNALCLVESKSSYIWIVASHERDALRPWGAADVKRLLLKAEAPSQLLSQCNKTTLRKVFRLACNWRTGWNEHEKSYIIENTY